MCAGAGTSRGHAEPTACTPLLPDHPTCETASTSTLDALDLHPFNRARRAGSRPPSSTAVLALPSRPTDPRANVVLRTIPQVPDMTHLAGLWTRAIAMQLGARTDWLPRPRPRHKPSHRDAEGRPQRGKCPSAVAWATNKQPVIVWTLTAKSPPHLRLVPIVCIPDSSADADGNDRVIRNPARRGCVIARSLSTGDTGERCVIPSIWMADFGVGGFSRSRKARAIYQVSCAPCANSLGVLPRALTSACHRPNHASQGTSGADGR
jgi:hypothetical protein